MSNIEKFINEWFPKTEEWSNVAKFILESGVNIVEEQNGKWLPGYTNISRSSKPHHKDKYTRYMEENLFVLHDICHNIFTINILCDEEEFVKRQIIGELFVFYLTEYEIPKYFEDRHQEYIVERGCYDLIENVLLNRRYHDNEIDCLWDVFIEGTNLETTTLRFDKAILDKYRKMFQQDLENSRKNYTFVKELQLSDYCMVGETNQNHIDFFKGIKKGAIKNIKREFNLELPIEWI